LNNFLSNKSRLHQNLEFTLISFLLIFPKIDLINILNFHQGIRAEDLIVTLFAISLYKSNLFKIKKDDFGYYFYLYFIIIFISIINGLIYFNQIWIILPRYLEYIIILIYFNRSNPNLESIFLILRIYLVANFIVVILQQNGLMGEFSSLGYQNPLNLTDDRPTGLTGGPWELSNCSAIIFFTLLLDNKQSDFKKYIFSFIIIYLILATKSRTIIVAFIFAFTFYLYFNVVKKKNFYVFLMILISFVFIVILNFDIVVSFFYDLKIYLELFPIFENFIFKLEKPDTETLDGRLWSMAYRIEHWLILYNQFLLNPFTIVFGIGSTLMYYESTLFRILFGTGIIGLVFVLYSIKKIPLHILILLIINSFSLDLLLSFKIFITLLLYFFILNKVKYDYRN